MVCRRFRAFLLYPERRSVISIVVVILEGDMSVKFSNSNLLNIGLVFARVFSGGMMVCIGLFDFCWTREKIP
jgi:hypothetical protein